MKQGSEPDKLSDFYDSRRGKYVKSRENEQFQDQVNDALAELEQSLYRDQEQMIHPAIYVLGAPRSGTTLLSQVLSQGIDAAYIDNIHARFYRAPLTALKLFRNLSASAGSSDFQSEFATTKSLRDIHEFGYFWKYHLKKGSLSHIVRSSELESSIDWKTLRLIILNIQAEFSRPFVAKNILAGYHVGRFIEEMPRTLFIHIRRDPADAAVSILNARRKYYGDERIWWSYVPLEYEQIRDLPAREQIAAQVFLLRKYYRRQAEVYPDNVMTVDYADLCSHPAEVLHALQERCRTLWNYELQLRSGLPALFPFNSYPEELAEKKEFRSILGRLEAGEYL